MLTLNLYPIDYPLEDLNSKLLSGKIVYSNSYDYYSPNASVLLESILMRLPMPSINLAELPDKTLWVINGIQRLLTVSKFLQDEFPLKNLTIFTHLEGKRFSELGEYQSLSSETLRCVILRKDNPPELIQDVFSKLSAYHRDYSEFKRKQIQLAKLNETN